MSYHSTVEFSSHTPSDRSAVPHIALGRKVVTRRVGFAARVLALFNGWGQMRVLAQLDHHALRDIGLTEADVIAARYAPLLQDPTQLLAERARARCARQSR